MIRTLVATNIKAIEEEIAQLKHDLQLTKWYCILTFELFEDVEIDSLMEAIFLSIVNLSEEDYDHGMDFIHYIFITINRINQLEEEIVLIKKNTHSTKIPC